MNFRLGELFCGPGGIGLGAALAAVPGARFEHVWATDIDRDSCRTYQHNIRGAQVIRADIAELRKANFARLERAGDINALSFGFPCNDFSVVGKQAGSAGVFGGLYRHCVAAVAHFAPVWFFAENVAGLKSADEGETLANMLAEFAELGYRLHPNLYSFDRYGVPQKRQRIIIIGIRGDQEAQFAIPSAAPHAGVDISAGAALRDIPPGAHNHDFMRQSAMVIERLRHIRPGENAFTASLPEHLRLNVGGAKISVIYRRLDESQPAYTITGSGGGGTHVYHWDEPRALTNRERARLQSFPDSFEFIGSRESVRRQIGMAVPPLAAKVIFEALAKSFLGVPYSAESANMEEVWPGGEFKEPLRLAV